MKYSIQTGENNPILRTISTEVDKITGDILQFCTTLRKMMRQHDGVGLAAPQIGVNIRVIATSQRDRKNNKNKLLGETIMINPCIIDWSQEMAIDEEACISLPDTFGKVKRHKAVTVTYLDTKGHKQVKKLKDFNARIIQHEIDHLDGVLFVDKIIKGKK